MNQIKLNISQHQYLNVTYNNINTDQCQSCEHCDIYYVDESLNIDMHIGYDLLSSFWYYLSGDCNDMIFKDNRFKDNTDDLGMQRNEVFQGRLIAKDYLKYMFSSNSHKQIRPYYDSWLYPNNDETATFEVTPFYPWYNKTKKQDPTFVPYNKWIKSYKPALKVIVPKENIQQWINQALEMKKELPWNK